MDIKWVKTFIGLFYSNSVISKVPYETYWHFSWIEKYWDLYLKQNLLFANICHFEYIFKSYYYLGDCSSGRYVCNKSKRSCTDFCGYMNCENTDPPMTMAEGQDDDDRYDL